MQTGDPSKKNWACDKLRHAIYKITNKINKIIWENVQHVLVLKTICFGSYHSHHQFDNKCYKVEFEFIIMVKLEPHSWQQKMKQYDKIWQIRDKRYWNQFKQGRLELTHRDHLESTNFGLKPIYHHRNATELVMVNYFRKTFTSGQCKMGFQDSLDIWNFLKYK